MPGESLVHFGIPNLSLSKLSGLVIFAFGLVFSITEHTYSIEIDLKNDGFVILSE